MHTFNENTTVNKTKSKLVAGVWVGELTKRKRVRICILYMLGQLNLCNFLGTLSKR